MLTFVDFVYYQDEPGQCPDMSRYVPTHARNSGLFYTQTFHCLRHKSAVIKMS